MVFLPMQLEIYDKPDDQLKTGQLPELSERTALEEQIAKGRRLVWKHSDKMKVFITRFSCYFQFYMFAYLFHLFVLLL